MNKLIPFKILLSLILFSIPGYTQILANLKPETPIVNEQGNYIEAQLSAPSKAKLPEICLCCSTKRQEPILWIIKIKKKEYFLDTVITINKNLNPLYISHLEVLKDSTLLSQYGQAAKNGVVIISIAKKHDKEVFKSMKRYLTAL